MGSTMAGAAGKSSRAAGGAKTPHLAGRLETGHGRGVTFEILIARYGLVALFVGAGLEGETVAMIGGLLAHQRFFPLTGAMIAVAAGSFVADQIFFAIGRRFRDHPRVRKIAAKPGFAKALAAFERHPRSFIFAFRFIYGLRTVSPIAIGTTAIPARIFVPLNAAAAILWGVIFVGIGFVFGNGIERVFGKLRSAEHVLIAAAAVALLLFGAVRLLSFARSKSRNGAGPSSPRDRDPI